MRNYEWMLTNSSSAHDWWWLLLDYNTLSYTNEKREDTFDVGKYRLCIMTETF